MKQYIYYVKIRGMRCGMCELHIEDQIRKNFKIKKVTASRFKKLTTIISLEPLDEKQIEEVINKTGYIFEGITSEIKEKRSLFSR